MRRGRFFGQGEMRLALLALIVEQPRHGYELMSELEARSQGVYRPSAGSVYPTLQQLEDEGLATSERRDGKNVFTATERGRAEAAEHQEAIEQIWKRAEEWGSWGPADDPSAMAIARPAEQLVKTAFKAVARRGADADDVRAILERAREEIDGLAGSEDAS